MTEKTRTLWKELFRKGQREITRVHQLKSDFWGTDGVEGGIKYFGTFETAINGYFTSFEEWAKDRHERGLTTHILEVFGGGYFINDFEHIDSLTGFRLMNQDNELEIRYLKKGDYLLSQKVSELKRQKKRRIAEGNFFNYKMMRKVRGSLKASGTQFVDALIINPIGGVLAEDDIESQMLFGYQRFKSLYELLTNNDGLLLLKLKSDFSPFVSQLAEYLTTLPGLSVNYVVAENSLMVIKGTQAPATLGTEWMKNNKKTTL